jgi:hypothetical protein
LSKDQLLEFIQNESPELLGLLDDFKAKVDEVSSHVTPLVQRVQSGQIPTDEGMCYFRENR